MSTATNQPAPQAHPVSRLGEHLTRYGLVLVIVWFGLLKFTAFEAAGIRPLVAHSPLLSWAYSFLSVQGLSNAVGAVELVAAGLIALRPLSARAAALGCLLGAGLFLTTLTFLVTTPGAWESGQGGFPVPGSAAAFLLKDAVLLGASVWLLGEALGRPLPRTEWVG